MWREVWPRINSTRLRAHSMVSATNCNSASLAAASTGGAVTLIFSSPPSGSPISLLEARGCTLTASRTPPVWALRNAGMAVGAGSGGCWLRLVERIYAWIVPAGGAFGKVWLPAKSLTLPLLEALQDQHHENLGQTLPGGRCLTLIHRGAYDQLGRSYGRILQPASHLKLKIVLPTREVCVKGPGMIFKGNPRNYLTEIQLPVGGV